jgi:xylulokinase
LTGQVTLDPSNAALLQLRNYQKEEWSEAMCDASGVKSSQFPVVMAAHMIQGKVTVQASEATGLKTGTPVMAGTVDSSSAAIEAGVVEPGIAAEMTGTSTVVIMPNDAGLTEPSFIAMPHALPGLHLLLGAMVSSGGCLRWFRDQFGQQEVKAASEGKVDAYDLLTNQASEVSLGSDGIIFLPYMIPNLAHECQRSVCRFVTGNPESGTYTFNFRRDSLRTSA